MDDLCAGEVAKDISGYEGLYAVTTLGRVWSYPRLVVGCGNRKKWLQPGHWMKPQISGDPKKSGSGGYLQVGLRRMGERKMLCVHILVAKAFIPNPRGLDEGNHKDGVKTNNRADNLEWCTHAENMEHARRNGLYKNQSSRFRGVSFHKRSNKWVAFSKKDGKFLHLGLFATEIAAAEAREHYDQNLS